MFIDCFSTYQPQLQFYFIVSRYCLWSTAFMKTFVTYNFVNMFSMLAAV